MGPKMRVYFQPAFLICIAVLTGGEIIKPILGMVIPDKEPLPLKKPLDLLDEEDLSPYKVISKTKIENKQIVKELGTEDYIQWVLEDTDVAADSAVRKLLLFITYYELPDVVPHVPEECYTGSGFQRLTSDSITLEITHHGLPDRKKHGQDGRATIRKKIQGKCLIFGTTKSNIWQKQGKFQVLYFFNVNNEYAGSREEARIALNKNIFGKYSYFSKVELAFNQSPTLQSYGDEATSLVAGEKEALAAGQKLLGVILPILEARHWPDWPVLSEVEGKKE